jgi:DNA-binding transcriptional LysR family regulator
MDVTAHAMRYFVALSEELHFGRAAVRLHVTTPSLSEQIARLEKRFRRTLFLMGPRGVQLTDAGRELVPLARAVVDAHEAVSEWAADHPTAEHGTVRVGVFASAAAALRSRLVEELARRHPDMEVTTRRISIDEGFGLLRDGRIDVAYLPQPLPPDVPGVRVATVTRQERMLVLPVDHPLAAREAVSIEETNGEVFLPIATMDPAAVDWWLVDPRADGSSPARGPVAADFEGMLDLCAAGRGLGMANDFAAEYYARPGLTYVALTDVEEARTGLCWRADEREPAVRAYVATARRSAAEAASFPTQPTPSSMRSSPTMSRPE